MTDHPGKAALAAIVEGLGGVTPGPWRADLDVRNGEGDLVGCDGSEEDMRHIARCDPDTFRAIADYVAQLEARLAEAQGWQPIETAPTDGTPFQARIPGHGDDNIIAAIDVIGDDGEDCWAWAFVEDQEPPECWTDGICWAVNEDHVASVKPTRWMPLPKSPKGQNDDRPSRTS